MLRPYNRDTISSMSDPLTFGLLAFLLSLILHLCALHFFPRFKLLDRPAKYNLARRSLPYPTGIVSVLAFLIVFLILKKEISFQDGGLLLSILLLAMMTMLDDLKNLPPWLRLSIQFLIGFLIFATGTRIYTITNPLGGILKLDSFLIANQFSIFNFQFSIPGGLLPFWSGLFTILWLSLTMNAFNWFDGIPGQVSILSVIGALTIGFLSLSERVNQPEISLIAFMLAGIALASAVFDFPPNKGVMGDTGAMFFGLMLGALSIYAGGKVATALLVLGLPLIDSVLVSLTRVMKGKSPLKGDLDHLHHRLLKKGWGERKVIFLTVILGSAFGITALFLSTFQKFIAIILLTALILLLRWYSRPRQTPVGLATERSVPPFLPLG